MEISQDPSHSEVRPKGPKHLNIVFLAFAVGTVLMFLFFAVIGPYTDNKTLVMSTLWAVLTPVALGLGFRSGKSVLLAAVVLEMGVYFGTCLGILILFPNEANLFPIAAVIWTAVTFLPVATGSLLGAGLRWAVNAKKRGAEPGS